MTTSTRTAPGLRRIPITLVKEAGWNPKRRTLEKNLVALKRSIENVGMITPIILNTELKLIDGHRRLHVAIALGWEEINALIIDTDYEQTYGEVNCNQRGLSTNDQMGVFLANPNALAPQQRTRVEHIEKIVGKRLLSRLYQSGMSQSSFRAALSCSNYIEGRKTVGLCLEWIIEHEQPGMVWYAVGQKAITPDDLFLAIDKNRALELKVEHK